MSNPDEHVVTVTGRYDGGLRCTATHGPSGQAVETDAPLDNNGRGERFSPTDLVGTALATCVLTICGIVAERDGFGLDGTTFHVEKRMSAAPRRIGSLVLRFEVPTAVTDEQLEKLRRAAATCPVHHSLHPDIDIDLTIERQG